MGLNLALWGVGALLLAVGILRVRGPLARRADLRATQENLRRYDDWRGNRLRPEPGERTGADEMLDLLTRQVRLWAGLAVLGGVLVLAGFIVR